MQHIIQQHVFDIAFSNAEKSYDLQNKISNIFENQLVAGMDQLFSRLVPANTVLSLNEVDIDIGKIAFDKLEFDLADTILYELEKEIRYRLSFLQVAPSEIENNSQQVNSVNKRYADLIEYFLLTGTIPWWAAGDLMFDPLKLMVYLLANEAIHLRQLIIKIGRQDYVRRRLVYQFSAQIVQDIINLLEPEEATFIFNYHKAVVKTQREDHFITSAANGEFDKVLWVFIFTFILVERGSLFNEKSFVKSNMAALARHYNRGYVELLTLLTKALHADKATSQHNALLPLIIEELYFEEFSQRSFFQNTQVKDDFTSEDDLSNDIELIKHYLVFGSLPWWAQPYAPDNLAALFLSLLKTHSQEIIDFVIAAGQNEEVRRRLVLVFNDEVIFFIVKLIQPADAEFILNYVNEVESIHFKNALIVEDKIGFKKSIRKFVLDFLLPGSRYEFDKRLFLAAGIMDMAKRFNTKYEDMLGYITQGISQVHQQHINYVPLFKLLTELLQDSSAAADYLPWPGNLDQYQKTKYTAEMSGERNTVMLKDIVLHWLSYGTLPWWGREYFDWDAAKMVETLLSSAPWETSQILIFAGTRAVMQQRVIHQLRHTLVIKIFELFAPGNEPVKLYRYFFEALDLSRITQPETRPYLLFLFWNIYVEGNYKTFNPDTFINSVITYLNQHFPGKLPEVINNLKALFLADEKAGYLKTIEKSLPFLASTKAGRVGVVEEIEEYDIYERISNFLTIRQTDSMAVVNEAFTILKYFLVHKKIPDYFKNPDQAYVKAVIKELLLFLNKADQSVFSQQLKKAEVVELYAFIDSAPARATIDGSIEQLIIIHLVEKGPVTDRDIMAEGIGILEYFLINNKLPEYLANVNTSAFLKQLIILLGYHELSALNNLLGNTGHLPAARILIHNIFAVPENIAENHLVQILRPYFQADALLYVKQLPGLGTSEGEKLKEWLAPYLAKPQNYASFIISLLKQPSMAGFVALNYPDSLIQSLIRLNSSLIGGAKNISFVNQLHQMFNMALSDTTGREWFNKLYREFNLRILGGHIIIKEPKDYLQSFFSFLSQTNYNLYRQLINALSNPTFRSSPVALKFPEVLKKTNAHHEIAETAFQAQASLIKADQQLLQKIYGQQSAVEKGMDAKKPKPTKIQELPEAEENNKPYIADGEAIYINNAGLVLLNPFLSTFFVRLGMLEAGSFINTDIQLRAVHLLQYLVNYKQQSSEHELVLNKILCNIPVNEPVPLEITLSDHEKNMSDQLLKAVLNAWDKMKNTSIPGFQSSFLQRSGSLIFKDDAWNLRVEQRGYDVLLQTLPWNIGMIKCPWMENFLYVEWT